MQWAKMEVVVIIDRYIQTKMTRLTMLTRLTKKVICLRQFLSNCVSTRREKCNIKAISEEKYAESVCKGPTVNYMSAAVKFRFRATIEIQKIQV